MERVIENLEGDEQVYVDHLDNMNAYFAKYLGKIGIKIDNYKK